LYGEKYIALQKLATIHKLNSNLMDDETKVEVVKLVYSLAASGKELEK
jgi:hypothetical protein